VLQCVAVCCSASQCVAVCLSVLQCVSVLQYVAQCANPSRSPEKEEERTWWVVLHTDPGGADTCMCVCVREKERDRERERVCACACVVCVCGGFSHNTHTVCVCAVCMDAECVRCVIYHLHTLNDRSLLQKSPIKETIFCKRDT